LASSRFFSGVRKKPFASSRLTASLTLDDTVEVKSLGLAYVNALSFNTVAVLVRVEGKPVIVYLDKVDANPTLSAGSSLHLYEGSVAGLAAYEVSPFAVARALSHIRAR